MSNLISALERQKIGHHSSIHTNISELLSDKTFFSENAFNLVQRISYNYCKKEKKNILKTWIPYGSNKIISIKLFTEFNL